MMAQTTAPRILSEAELATIQVNDEGVRLLMHCIAFEAHKFAALRNVTERAVEDQLPFVFSELNRSLGDLLDVRSVPARDASCLASVSISFSYPVYRLVADAAKDRAVSIVNGD